MMGHVTGDLRLKSQFWLQIRKVGGKVTSRIMTLKSLELSLGSGTYI